MARCASAKKRVLTEILRTVHSFMTLNWLESQRRMVRIDVQALGYGVQPWEKPGSTLLVCFRHADIAEHIDHDQAVRRAECSMRKQNPILPRFSLPHHLCGGGAWAPRALGCASLEAIRGTSGNRLQVSHPAGAGGLSPLSLLAPVDCTPVLTSFLPELTHFNPVF